MPGDEFQPLPDEFDRIRELHDRFRTTLSGGIITFDETITRLGLYDRVLKAVREYQDFAPDDALHDSGEVTIDDHRIRWSIECRNKGNLLEPAADPTDIDGTTFVLQLMLQP